MTSADFSKVLETIAQQPTIFTSILDQALAEAKEDCLFRDNWKASINYSMESEAHDTFLRINNYDPNLSTKYQLVGLFFSNDRYKSMIHQVIEKSNPPKYSPDPVLNPQPA
tara:strand:+ start:35 stop:367 length:333 start_codon:yes stop_codon:yes gene_type:complete